MQFNRTNYSNPSQDEASPDQDPREQFSREAPMTPAVDPNQVNVAQAPWQAAFRLAPNVRFTRTPESALAKPKLRAEVSPVAPEERMPAAESRLVEPLDVNSQHQYRGESLAPELLVDALQNAAQAMQHPVAPSAPKVKPQPSPRALIVKRARPNYNPAEEAVAVAPQSAPEQVQAAPANAVISTETLSVAPESVSPWLSDFAFFEGGFDGSFVLPQAPQTEPVVPQQMQPVAAAQRPVPQGFPGRRPTEIVRQPLPSLRDSVVSLYREVRRAERPAPVQQEIEEPRSEAQAAVRPVSAHQITPVGGIPPFMLSQPWAPALSPQSEPAVETVASTPVAELHETSPEFPVAAAAPVRNIVSISPRAQIGLPGLGDIRTVRPSDETYEFPPISLLQEPYGQQTEAMQPDTLQQSAGLLESILEDFGVKGEIIDVRPGPVVTLYEFEPAPGVKSSRVIGLADDIARSMSALSARVAVVPGRNVIGIELPNAVREMVFFRELIECEDYWETKHRLPLCLGKTIGGEPVIAELAKMPHLLVAGTTGSGKSVAINTMILSLLYRLRPEECRLIMIDPKMLELSVYDGIPHLLTPVVTDPKKAVLALKWAVREMEDRYRKMSRLGVRNIDGYNTRAAQAREKGETITVSVQTGFDRNSGEIVYEDQELDLSPMPYIVVVVDEMADLMMVAGKEIEGAIQRLAQMARAAGIHLIMATQRPSVDVITGTIKANFPTRISFQVTSKIDSRTILGEQGAEHLLGQGDMLHMAGGGRIMRVHGPFVSDAEVEHVVTHLKAQGRPDYLGTVTEDENELEDEAEEDSAVFDRSGMGAEDGDDLYEKAVKVVMKDRKCSTSYIQRRLSIGYNRAASLVERMEQEGLVGPANHVGKREIIAGRSGAAADE
ncbi:DNA translocase FtsK [Rhizobium helianthi]|uniref:DNA translocase FtsK n=1 Tax=Rhizobium helianthi TaxID=1132695 RepID=A0ABW4M133_9HYPH